ncbi:hypothetical protein [Fulvivirga sedimenti]|uniref:N-acetylglucosamine kinase n=1 Tax=Fulvivirga sedimenti TaxID=2879465 RepID=A0A9X1HMM3_9BACT|nr:hypothetical protein [Fulvivirga sedimenti]MCA6073377.1 hypothetical protein [Fulvivirga sedimenti]
MTIIGVSGSTKCDWAILHVQGKVVRCSTRGINPLFHDEDDIAAIIQSSAVLTEHARDTEAVFIYGAGCSSRSRQNIVRNALSVVFTRAHRVVNHDIVASALATYRGEPIIAAILGTGSNACYYDGDIVRQEVPALDYILGDEGGGAYFGKQLLNAFLYRKLPAEIQSEFENSYQLTRDDILEKVYQEPYANVYLASFMPFIQTHQESPYFKNMLLKGFRKFFETQITSFPKHQQVTVHFTGSVAYYFQELLNEVAREFKVKTGMFLKEPIEGLITYHENKLKSA